MATKCFLLQFEITTHVLVTSFRFIWIPGYVLTRGLPYWPYRCKSEWVYDVMNIDMAKLLRGPTLCAFNSNETSQVLSSLSIPLGHLTILPWAAVRAGATAGVWFHWACWRDALWSRLLVNQLFKHYLIRTTQICDGFLVTSTNHWSKSKKIRDFESMLI